MYVIRQLQKTIDNLNAELDDEKAESSRKDSEPSALSNLLKDKERLLVEASELTTLWKSTWTIWTTC